MKSLKHLALFMIVLVAMLPVCFADTISLTYDNNGNLVSGDGYYREYNNFNQLHKIYEGDSDSGTLLEEFIFHPLEERILLKKVYNSSGSVIEEVYYFDKDYVAVVNDSGRYDYTYIKHNGQLVAQKNPDGNKLFIHADNIGSTSVVTDESGNTLENTTYSPFGAVVSGGEKSRFGYESKEHDSVVGDTDFHFRKYKPQWGIFLQPDTFIQDVYTPQTLNRYTFEKNSPYRNADEDGHVVSEIVSIMRTILNPSKANFIGLWETLVVDNLVSTALILSTGVPGVIYEISSDAYTITGIDDVGIYEFWYNEQDNGLIDKPLSYVFVEMIFVPDEEKNELMDTKTKKNSNIQAKSDRIRQESVQTYDPVYYTNTIITGINELYTFLVNKAKSVLDSFNGGSAFGGGAGCSGTGCLGEGGSIDPDTGKNMNDEED